MERTARMLCCSVISVAPGDSVLSACRLMRDKRVGCVLVVEGGTLAGIFTERDLLTRVVPDELPPAATPVSRVMTRDPQTVGVDEPVERVFELLAARRFRHVPIVDGGRPVGMVSLSDFAGILGEVFEEDAYLRYFADYCQARPKGR
ncbi:MAG: CBS domain-containing protein [Elusimicrobia bacterium]|nr:CBS domain-containing protein [Elusimicrobiota bacterium]